MKTFERKKTIKQLGIDTSRKFLVVDGTGNFNKGDILTLINDDNTHHPIFRNQNGKEDFTFLVNLAYAEEELKEGDMVYVSNESEEDALVIKDERILLRKCSNGYVCIDNLWEVEYKKGETFNTAIWKYAVPVYNKQPIKEYTIEQLQEKIGEQFKIIK